MNTNLLFCDNCKQKYDSAEHIPVIIPQCGHTICKSCSDKSMKSKKPACPFDKTPFFSLHNGQYVEPQINSIALHLVQNAIEFKKCPDHGEKCIYYCLEDCKPVCGECLLFGDQHKHHTIEKLENIKKKLNRKEEALTQALKEIENLEKGLCEMLCQKRTSDQRMIEDIFEEEERILKRQKQDLKFTITAAYEQEKERLKSLFGESSKSLDKKIAECDINYPGLPQILDEDLSDLMSKYDPTNVEQCIAAFQRDLDSLRIEEQPNIMAQIMRTREIQLPDFYLNPENSLRTTSLYMSPDFSLQGLTYDISGPYTFSYENGKLNIKLTPTQNEDCWIDLEKIKNMKTVELDLLSVWLTDDELIPLEYIFSQMSQMTSITINCISLNQGTTALEKTLEIRLEDLFSVLFQQSKKLKEIKLIWKSKNGTEEALNLICEKALTQACPLENLEICIENAPVTFQNYENFMEKLESYQETLQKLTFVATLHHLEGAQIRQCPELPHLKNLNFSVKCGCSKTYLHKFDEVFWVEFLRPMELLESLDFSYGLATQDLKSLKQILKEIKKAKNLENLKIGISYPQEAVGEEKKQNNFANVVKAISGAFSKTKKLRSILFGLNSDSYRELKGYKDIPTCLDKVMPLNSVLQGFEAAS